MKICNNISQTIGNTPLVRFRSIEKAFGLEAKIYAKIESFNPAGSAKDRVALFMINDAEEKGLIQPGATIIEPTSGNTGIGLAAVGLSRGYKVILTMPETMSIERVNLLKAYGASVILTEGSKGSWLKKRRTALSPASLTTPPTHGLTTALRGRRYTRPSTETPISSWQE